MTRLITKLGKVLRLSMHPAYRAGLWHRVGAAIEHEGALGMVGLAALVDVGANKGQFSLLTKALFPDALIYAFEPLHEAAQTFRRIFERDQRVVLHELALGEVAGACEINISGHADSSSLLPITPRQSALFPGTARVGTRTITVARGDDILGDRELPRPLMVKLDVQGSELSALRGMQEVLRRTDYVYAEVSFQELYAGQPLADEVIAYLREQRFHLQGVFNLVTAPDRRPIQVDALFARRE